LFLIAVQSVRFQSFTNKNKHTQKTPSYDKRRSRPLKSYKNVGYLAHSMITSVNIVFVDGAGRKHICP
jgi:hypothetical protein